MEKLTHTELFLKKYREISREKDSSVSQEIYLLSEVREYLEWQTYSNKEKHEKRKFVLNVIKKMGNAEEFVIETTVIELYELVETILEEMGHSEDSHLKTRLNAMLDVFVLHVNEQRDTRYMQTSSFDLIINIAKQCLTNEVLKSLHQGLKELVILFEKLGQLKFKKVQ